MARRWFYRRNALKIGLFSPIKPRIALIEGPSHGSVNGMTYLLTHAQCLRGRVVAAMLVGCLVASFAPMAMGQVSTSNNMPRADIKTLFPDPPKRAVQPTSPDEPVSIEAESMGYDKDHNIAVAVGHVVVVQGGYVLNADRVTFYQAADTIEATGNVSILQPTGDVYFADHADLHDSMKRGVAQAFKARLADNSLLAAKSARKISESTTVLNKAVYSPCHVCEAMAPFWQLKANQITTDEQAEKITYNDARLEMFGVPTLYTPYLSSPTPNAAGQSGFMPPLYTANSNLGAGAKIPYYWRIGEDKDLLLTPWLLSAESPILEGSYRQRLNDGEIEMKFSATDPQRRDSTGALVSGNEFRGNIDAKGVKNIDDSTRVGFDINRASDQTYLARYGYGNEQVLFSRLYAETAQQRNAGSIQALAIQGLRVGDNPKTTPSVAPMLEGYYETQPRENGVRFHVAGNAQSLTREVWADQRRISVTGGATVPYVTENGQVLNVSANLRQDLYNLNDVTVAGSTDTYNGTQVRSIPQAALQWRYPLIRASNGDALTIEPIALGVAQPTGGNLAKIDNEDSRTLELSDTNLFDIDRVPGYDVVDSGSRLAYGVRTEYLLQGGESLEGLLGQNYSFDAHSPFPNSSTPNKNASDIVGRAAFNLAPISLAYRFAFNADDFSPNRSQFSAGFSKPWLSLGASYNSVRRSQYVPQSEQLDFNGKLPLTDEWSLYGSTSRDLQLNRMIAAGSGLIYHNECFDFTLDGMRNYTQDRDVGSNSSFTARIAFKNLGVFGG